MSDSSSCKRQLLLGSLIHFFEQRPAHKETMYNIIQGLSPISLRVLDWFVTHYAKVHQTMYWYDAHEVYSHATPNQVQLKKFHVYFDYRAQLKSFSKTHFDPFRRHERISFIIEERPQRIVLETTVGQLNFFKWALENKVIQYVTAHLSDIEASMTLFYQQTVNKKKQAGVSGKGANGTGTGAGAGAGAGAAGAGGAGSNVKHMASGCILKFD